MMSVASNRLVAALAAAVGIALGTSPGLARADVLVDFEDLALAPNSHFEGIDATPFDWTYTDNPWSSRGMMFNNQWAHEIYFGFEFDTWQGQTYSNHTWSGSPPSGLAGQYVAYPGSGAGGSPNYAVFYVPTSVDGSGALVNTAILDLPPGERIQSLDVTNNTYAWNSMKYGDSFSKAFGGVSGGGGSDPDWFLLTITGLDSSGTPIAASPVEVYLADYRAANPADDYILETWKTVDLSGLGDAAKLEFRLTSSDSSVDLGMSTPAYVLVDNIAFGSSVGPAVPEPSSLVLAAAGGAALGGLRLSRRRRSKDTLAAR